MDTPARGVEQSTAVIYNPQATNRHKQGGLLAAIDQHTPGQVTRIETSRDPAADMVRLRTAVPIGSDVLVVGGDGTAHVVVAASRHPDAPSHLKEATFGIIPSGRMSDFATMLGATIHKLLRRDRTVALHPIDYTVSDQTGNIIAEGEALYSLVFGVGAAIAKGVNQPERRALQKRRGRVGRWVADLKLANQCARDAVPLPMTGKKIISVIIAKGPIMSGLLRFPVRLSRHELFVSTTGPKTPDKIVTILGQLTGSGIDGTVIRSVPGATLYEVVLQQPVTAAADGEMAELPAGLLRIGLAADSTNFYTTKSKP